MDTLMRGQPCGRGCSTTLLPLLQGPPWSITDILYAQILSSSNGYVAIGLIQHEYAWAATVSAVPQAQHRGSRHSRMAQVL